MADPFANYQQIGAKSFSVSNQRPVGDVVDDIKTQMTKARFDPGFFTRQQSGADMKKFLELPAVQADMAGFVKNIFIGEAGLKFNPSDAAFREIAAALGSKWPQGETNVLPDVKVAFNELLGEASPLMVNGSRELPLVPKYPELYDSMVKAFDDSAARVAITSAAKEPGQTREGLRDAGANLLRLLNNLNRVPYAREEQINREAVANAVNRVVDTLPAEPTSGAVA